MSVKKAVIAVAGYGTRFLPATKAIPKELLPIVNKPIVQYLVEEAVESGIENVILVTRSGAHAISDHFDSSRELEIHLSEQGSHGYQQTISKIPKMANFAFVRQSRHLPYGNGTPLLAAQKFLEPGEPFVYMFGDDLVLSQTPCVKQLIDLYDKNQPAAVVAFQDVARTECSRYGIAKLKPETEPPELEFIVEKPAPEDAPSTLAQIGRFVLSYDVVEVLASTKLGKGNELYLTDAIDALCRNQRVLAHRIDGHWFTTGDPLRFLIANVEYALRSPDIAADFAAYLQTLDLSAIERC